jgi:hypothetical protein
MLNVNSSAKVVKIHNKNENMAFYEAVMPIIPKIIVLLHAKTY